MTPAKLLELVTSVVDFGVSLDGTEKSGRLLSRHASSWLLLVVVPSFSVFSIYCTVASSFIGAIRQKFRKKQIHPCFRFLSPNKWIRIVSLLILFATPFFLACFFCSSRCMRTAPHRIVPLCKPYVMFQHALSSRLWIFFCCFLYFFLSFSIRVSRLAELVSQPVFRFALETLSRTTSFRLVLSSNKPSTDYSPFGFGILVYYILSFYYYCCYYYCCSVCGWLPILAGIHSCLRRPVLSCPVLSCRVFFSLSLVFSSVRLAPRSVRHGACFSGSARKNNIHRVCVRKSSCAVRQSHTKHMINICYR